MYNKNQKILLKHARSKVKKLFEEHPVKAHSFDHAVRVSKSAVIIAKAERVDVFLSEVAALLHDIGRVPEEFPGNTKRHHELSYEMCRDWFRNDKVFDVLSKEEKLSILYALRYHWNDAANKYRIAWVLRDADKLDALGSIGLKRSVEFFDKDENKIMQNLRLKGDMVLNLRSKKARSILKSKNLFEPIRRYYYNVLRKQIEPVEL